MFRFSIRELALLVAFVGLSCAALKYAGAMWQSVLSACAFLVFMAIAVVVIVDRGERQAMASGFVLWMGAYVALLFLHSDTRRFATEKLLNPVFELLVTRTWIDDRTGQVIPDYDPAQPSRPVSEQTVPERHRFMGVGHVLWALLLGYIGSRLAGWLYLRRTRREAAGRP